LLDIQGEHGFAKSGLFGEVSERNLLSAPACTQAVTSTEDLRRPAKWLTFFDHEQAIMSSGQPLVDFEEPFHKEDGQERWFLTSKVPLRNRQGALIGLAGVTRDVTEKAFGKGSP